MRSSIVRMAVIASLAFSWPLHAGETAAEPARQTAFVDVNVVPMDRHIVLRHQTVIVQDRLIVELGPASDMTVPAGARRIEGRGTAYLLPGLADMHTHVIDAGDLLPYTANGVTTILHMGLAPDRLVGGVNESIARGDMVGPQVFFSFLVDGSPALRGLPVATPEQGRAAVERAKASGYEFIKLYNNVSPPVFTAIVEEARRQELAIIGHAVRSVGLPRALFEGQVMVAYAEEFYYTAFRSSAESSRIPDVVAATARSGAFVTPNLSTIETIGRQWGKPEVVTGFLREFTKALTTSAH